MNPLIDALSRFGATALLSFWLPLVTWTVIAVAALFLLRRWRRLHPIYHYHARLALLTALPLGLLLMPVIDIDLPRLLHKEVIQPFTSLDFLPELPGALQAADSATAVPVATNWTLFTWVGLIAALGCIPILFRLIRLGLEWVTLQQLRGTLLTTDHTALSYKAYMMGIRRPVQCAVTLEDTTPMTFGWWRPVVVIPSRLFDHEVKLDAVLTHELVHVARYDYVFRCLERLLRCVMGFNPVLKTLCAELDQYREMSCDAEVLMRTVTTKKAYATLLQEMLPTEARRPALSMPMATLPGQLRARIVAMKRYSRSPWSYRRMRSGSTTMALLLGVGVMILVACSASVVKTPKLIGTIEPAQGQIQMSSLDPVEQRTLQFELHMHRLSRQAQADRINAELERFALILNRFSEDVRHLTAQERRHRVSDILDQVLPVYAWLDASRIEDRRTLFPEQRDQLRWLLQQQEQMIVEMEEREAEALLRQRLGLDPVEMGDGLGMTGGQVAEK